MYLLFRKLDEQQQQQQEKSGRALNKFTLADDEVDDG